MSRVYRALEKAEEEKRQKVKEEPSLKVYEEKVAQNKEAPTLPFPEERIARIKRVEETGLPPKEEVPLLVVPPNSLAEEEFRKLKTQIFLRLPNPPHSILITSAAPQEGKTTVAVNLAMAISREIYRKAILIDGDLRRPGIRFERGQNRKGLSNYLSDETPLAEILTNSQIKNLRIITAGSSTNKSSELIGSKKMGELLKSLNESGEDTYILIDSPPIISAAEPISLSKLVDGIILVVKANQTHKEAVLRAVNGLDREKIIGVVLNQIDLKSQKYYEKDYYRNYGK